MILSRCVKSSSSRLILGTAVVSKESKVKFNLFNLLKVRGGSSSSGSELLDLNLDDFKILSEKEAYRGKYRQMIEKVVEAPDGKKLVFDILSNNKCGGVTMFVWNTKTRSATLVKEYSPGPHKVLLGTVNGCFETDKHESAEQCAEFELEEEVQMRVTHQKNIIPLIEAGGAVPLDKYSDNRFYSFLVLDAEPVLDPRKQDEEEYIIVERGVGYDELMRLMKRGEINVASSYTILMGIKKLEELGYPLQ